MCGFFGKVKKDKTLKDGTIGYNFKTAKEKRKFIAKARKSPKVTGVTQRKINTESFGFDGQKHTHQVRVSHRKGTTDFNI